MSLTPSSSRMMSPALGGTVKLTPSPFVKNAPLRSPVKASRTEVTLALRQVVGTTASGANAFDSLPSAGCFAYTAGAAAVIATVGEDCTISQRFFRARPTTNPLNPSASIYGGPSTPTQNESRNRTAASLRDAGLGLSPFASPAANDWTESPGNRAWTAKEKIKAATCLSFSPDGKWLAVGETGYKPRVLVFSTSPDASSDTPSTSLADHSFGVNCVAFSPDSRYLASLGTANDGFLHIWTLNARTGAASLYASNKCVSNVNQIAWMGNKLITVGTRHVKVWKVDDPTSSLRISKARQSEISFLSGSMHKTLPGRNCILDNLKEATFTSVVTITPVRALVATDKGDICIIDDVGSEQRFSKLFDAGFAVSSMAVDSKRRLHLVGSQEGLKTVSIQEILKPKSPRTSPVPENESSTLFVPSANPVNAVACLTDYVVIIDSQHASQLLNLCAANNDSIVGDIAHTLPAHGDAVLGVAAVLKKPTPKISYYTWAADGTIIFWGHDANSKDSLQILLEQIDGSDATPNELKTVSASADAEFVVTGDKYGVLRVIDRTTRDSVLDFKAHASEITSIAVHEAEHFALVACASRDRTVQVFVRTSETWDLLQTLDEHVGAVNNILFSPSGLRLVSSSGDRTLVVREMVSREDEGRTIRAFVMLRAIMLKASPVSLAWDVDQDDTLIVSTIDRQVHRFDTRTGHCLSSFRACDSEGGDAVVLSSLVHIPRGWSSPLIAGVSSTDKSIRIYDENGILVARDWGHTEGISDIALVDSANTVGDDSNDKSIVTVAVDGTIFLWDLALQPPSRQDLSRSMDMLTLNTPSNQDLIASRPPLRRVFSQSELARFQRSSEEDAATTTTITPTSSRSPKLRKKTSKFSLAQTPKLDPSPVPPSTREGGRIPAWQAQGSLRRNKNRSPSPPSPRNPQLAKRRASIDVRSRNKAPASEFGSIGASTESLCRTLRAYRKRLANTTDTLPAELVRDVERELASTARAIGERAKPKELDESVMVKLLDAYSERLVSLLDEKIAASVAARVREGSVEIDGSEEVFSPTSEDVLSPRSAEEGEGSESKEERGVEAESLVHTPIMESVEH